MNACLLSFLVRRVFAILGELQGQLLKAQSDYSIRSAYVSPKAPQLRITAQKIQSLQEQIKNVQAQITAAQESGNDYALSQKLSRFANLELEQKIAEKRYADASTSLNMARIYSERKMLYLHIIETPAQAEEPRYPRRWLNVGMIFLGSILTFLACMGVAGVLQRRMS